MGKLKHGSLGKPGHLEKIFLEKKIRKNVATKLEGEEVRPLKKGLFFATSINKMVYN